MSRVARCLTVVLVLGLVASLAVGSSVPAAAQEESQEAIGLPSVQISFQADGSYDLGLEGVGVRVRLPFGLVNNVLGFFGYSLPRLDPAYIGLAQQYGIQHAQICWHGGRGELAWVVNDEPLPWLFVEGEWLVKPVEWARDMGWEVPSLPYEQIQMLMGKVKLPVVIRFPVPEGVFAIPVTKACGGRLAAKVEVIYGVDLQIFLAKDGTVWTAPHSMPGYEYLGDLSLKARMPWLRPWLESLPVGMNELNISLGQEGLAVGLDGIRYGVQAGPEQWQGLATLAGGLNPGYMGMVNQAYFFLGWARGDVYLRLVDEVPLPEEAVAEIDLAQVRAADAEARTAAAESRLAEIQTAMNTAIETAVARAVDAEEKLVLTQAALQEAQGRVEELILEADELALQIRALQPVWSHSISITVAAGDTLWDLFETATEQVFGSVWLFPAGGALLAQMMDVSVIRPGDEVIFAFQSDQEGKVFFVGQEGSRLWLSGFDPPPAP